MDEIPTLDVIATKSGFSKSTVSLALRKHPRIPETTRKVIERIAAEINYRPDPALARIAANRWRRIPSQSTLAFVTTNHPDGGLLDTETIKGARKRAEIFGYYVEHFRFEDYGSAKRLGAAIYNRGIKGIILGKLCVEGFFEAFPWEKFAAVACDTGFIRPDLPMVMPDHAHAVHRAWAEATAAGYRRIGLVLFGEVNAVDYFDKVSAYLYNQQFSRPGDRLAIHHLNTSDAASLADWVRREKPDAILGFNGFVHYQLTQLGFSIPRDFGFIALMAGETPHQNLTRLRENIELVAKIALDQLDIFLRTNQYGRPKFSTTLMVEFEWIPGATLPGPGPAKDRRQRSRSACH
ncbi:MAG: LacI family DNA-binding transcriptional regulator [Opitutaceae bacterium]|nr:LacI family DNA-binding transcriptional regulator [Opitutaceae bacterium]